jgi:hypothetical protein
MHASDFKTNQNKTTHPSPESSFQTENAKSAGPHLKDSAEGEALTGGSWRGSRPSSSFPERLLPTVCAQPDPERKSDDMAPRENRKNGSEEPQRETWLKRDLDGRRRAGRRETVKGARSRARLPFPLL